MYKFIGGISKSCIAFLENMKFNHVILYNGACRRKRSGKFWNLTYKIGWMSKNLIFVFGFFADHSELVLVHWTIDVISVCWFKSQSEFNKNTIIQTYFALHLIKIDTRIDFLTLSAPKKNHDQLDAKHLNVAILRMESFWLKMSIFRVCQNDSILCVVFSISSKFKVELQKNTEIKRI